MALDFHDPSREVPLTLHRRRLVQEQKRIASNIARIYRFGGSIVEHEEARFNVLQAEIDALDAHRRECQRCGPAK